MPSMNRYLNQDMNWFQQLVQDQVEGWETPAHSGRGPGRE